MKKRLCWLLCGLCFMVFAMQTAAAAPKKQARFARVAILPVICLQDNIDYANTVVFQKASALFKYPDYEIYDGDRLYNALQEVDYYEAGKAGVSEEMLRTIMQKAGLEMIVMVKLNGLTQRSVTNSREALEELHIDMDIMAIYGWLPKVTHNRIRDVITAEYATIMKTDWKLREYDRTVGFYLGRIAKRGMK